MARGNCARGTSVSRADKGAAPCMPGRAPLALAAAVSAALAAMPATAADPDESGSALEAIVVTAQKRVENLQEVPMSIQALGTEKLEELHVNSLDDYIQYLPNVNYVRAAAGLAGGGQPGTAHVYMRGVVSGGDGIHSGPSPSVGTYLDEQPVTTIDGALDVHMYDIERLEVLAGPQGTLYGASSESGTIRIITNKPDPKKFSAAYDVGIDKVDHGGVGWVGEGYINVPLASNAAIRLVGWDEHDAGFISNVAGTNVNAGIVNGVRTYPGWGSVSNAPYVKNDYNTVATKGARGALKIDLDDNWTITPTFMAQNMKANGFFGYDPAVGDLQVVHFGPEGATDTFAQSALTIQGKVQDFEITYAGAWMKRDNHSVADYSDYSFFYVVDNPGYGGAFLDNAGKVIDPAQVIYNDNWFSKLSHELRVNTPHRYPVKATIGAFEERQFHAIWQRYSVPGVGGDGLADSLSVAGWPNTLWLTDLQRVDVDKAVFAQATWDINPQWSLVAGLRQFWSDNSLIGFNGYGANMFYNFPSFYPPSPGVLTCGPTGGTPNPNYAPFQGAPCTNVDAETKDSGHTPLLTVRRFFNDDDMVYLTYSKGFRPGGANRARDPLTLQFLPPYHAEYLTNYEFGWKTKWDNDRLRWNGAVFHELWDNFQFNFLALSSLYATANAGEAVIDGMESELEWVPARNWNFAFNATILDGRLKQDYCGGPCSVDPVQAPSGTRLPVSPHYKGDLIARYLFNVEDWKSNVQATFGGQSNVRPLLVVAQTNATGMQPGFGMFDLSAGTSHNGLSMDLYIKNVFDIRAQLTRFTECQALTCAQPYVVPAQPRTIGFKIGQKF